MIRPILMLVLLLALTLGVRHHVISTFTQGNANIDLGIYREVGQWVSHGVNPYEPTEKTTERRVLQHDEIGSSNPFIISTAENYDYYVASNLPASTLLYGALAEVAQDDPVLW